MIIKTILLLILFFCIISLAYVFKNKTKDFFSKCLIVALLIIFVHTLHISVSECFFLHLPDTFRSLPYSLLYGPLFYLFISGLTNSKVKPYVWIIHLIPFLVFSFIYLIFLFDDILRVRYNDFFTKINFVLIPTSFAFYILVSFFQKQKVVDNIKDYEISTFVATLRLILVFIAIFLYVVGYTGGKETPAARVVIHSTLLVTVLNIYIYILRKKKNGSSIDSPSDYEQPRNVEKYLKVKITEQQLDEYEEKLYHFISKSNIFLVPDLSLSTLSKELKIPKYHLTQLFSLRIGKNFNQFINFYRINFASTIILENKQIKLEDLIYQCGFNSKSSFNRHFKSIIGVTPSQYCSREKK